MSESTTSSPASCANPSSCACAPTSSSSSGAIQNGKGDAPRNISEQFRSNYDGIKWSLGGGKARKDGAKFVKVY